MKITNKLPQFTDQTALLVVTGKQDAVFYLVKDGELWQVDSFKVDKPQYTDAPGHFEAHSQGRMIKAGSAYDPTEADETAVRDFLRFLKQELESVVKHHQLTALYVFCPGYLKNRIEGQLPKDLAPKEQMLIEGNYYNTHPFELLERIQKRSRFNPVRPLSQAAQKILRKFQKAQE